MLAAESPGPVVALAPWPGRTAALLAFAFALFLAVLRSRLHAAEPAAEPPRVTTAAELFDDRRLWDVSLEFSPEQWDALEPVRAAGRGTNASPRAVLAERWMNSGDADHDGKLSAAEFRGLAETWFGSWDNAGSGKLGDEALRKGLDAVLTANDGDPGSVAGANWIFNYVHANVEIAGRRFEDAGVRLKGLGSFAASQGSQKRSMKIDLNQFSKGTRFAGMTQFNLHSATTDAGMMNEVLALRMHREAGVPAPRTAFCRVYLTVKGREERHCLGVYTLVEDIGTHFAEEHFGTREGVVFKPVAPGLFADRGTEWRAHGAAYEFRGRVSNAEKLRLVEFTRLIHRATDAQFAARLGDFVGLDAFARFLAVSALLSDHEGILGSGQNLYLHLHPTTHRFAFVPWDQDRAWGRTVAGSGENARLSLEHPWRGTNRLLERAFAVPAFREKYDAHVREFAASLLAAGRIEGQVDELAAVIRPVVRGESAERSAAFEHAMAGEVAVDPKFGRPGRSRPIKAFVHERMSAVTEQLSGKSKGEVFAEASVATHPDELLAAEFLATLDGDRDGTVSRAEFVGGFERWFGQWDKTRAGHLTVDRLREGLERDLRLRRAASITP